MIVAWAVLVAVWAAALAAWAAALWFLGLLLCGFLGEKCRSPATSNGENNGFNQLPSHSPVRKMKNSTPRVGRLGGSANDRVDVTLIIGGGGAEKKGSLGLFVSSVAFLERSCGGVAPIALCCYHLLCRGSSQHFARCSRGELIDR